MIVLQTLDRHLPDLVRLWNEPEVMRWAGFPDGLGMTLDDAADWLERTNADPSRHHFVVLGEGNEFCGEAFYRVDDPPVTAGLDIKLLPEARGRGIATQALDAVIRWVFSFESTVDAVWTEPSHENTAAQRLYRRCGLAPADRPGHLPSGTTYWERRRPS